MTKDKQSGFTLIELSIVLLIAGIMVAGATTLVKPYIETSRRDATNEKIKIISSSLASFAQNYGRLPCPASTTSTAQPFGAPVGSGANGDDIAKNNCGPNAIDNVGVVPFIALGLTEDDIRDGYGNYFTYAVNPAMTAFNAAPGEVDDTSDEDLQLNSVCTQPEWKRGNSSKNIYKAHVCCPMAQAEKITVLKDKNAPAQELFQNAPVVPEVSAAGYDASCRTYEAAKGEGTFDDVGSYKYIQCYETDRLIANGKNINDAKSKSLAAAKSFLALYWPKVKLDDTSVNATSYGSPQKFGGYFDGEVKFTTSHPWEKSDPAMMPATFSVDPTQASIIRFCNLRCPQNVGYPDYMPGPKVNGIEANISYALVSHGVNGDYAFTRTGRLPGTASGNAQEAENGDNDLTFVSRPTSRADNDDYFDDIVYWETNERLVSHFGNNSCMSP